MRVFLAILAVIFCVLAEESVPTKEQMSDLVEECSRQYPVSAEQKGRLEQSGFPNDNEIIHNYVRCMMKGVAFHIIYYKEIERLKEVGKEKSTTLAEFCMQKFFNYDDKAANILVNIENCVKEYPNEGKQQ